MKFGTLELEHVQTPPIEHDWQEVDVVAPYRAIDYRREQYDLGRVVTVTGQIREATIADAQAALNALRSLSDGVVRLLDFEDGETTLCCMLGDITWSVDISGTGTEDSTWWDGAYWIIYVATFLECNPPLILGDPNIEALNGGLTAGQIVMAVKFTTAVPITARQAYIYFSSIFPCNMKLAVYPDSGGLPLGTSIVWGSQSYAVGAAAGWNEISLLPDDYCIIPEPGTYWLMFMVDTTSSGNVICFGGTPGASCVNSDYTYAEGFPSSISDLGTSDGPVSMYLIVAAA